jgi:DNA-binding FrmR family transcriptional regulator
MAKRITLRTIVEHIQGMRNSLEGRMNRLEGKMEGMERRMVSMDRKLSGQIDAVDKRLDTIEISIVEQNHEKRIRRIERHLKFAA